MGGTRSAYSGAAVVVGVMTTKLKRLERQIFDAERTLKHKAGGASSSPAWLPVAHARAKLEAEAIEHRIARLRAELRESP